MSTSDIENKNPDSTKDSGRNPDGTWKPGVSGNLSGRPKSPLKEYLRVKFQQMTPEEKEAFLKTVSPDLQWQMAEGRPSQGVGQADDLAPIPLLHVLDTNVIRDNVSDNKNTPTPEED